MIHEGHYGSVSGFYKGKLICSALIDRKRNLNSYKRLADVVIRQGLDAGWKIPAITKLYLDSLATVDFDQGKATSQYGVILICILIKFRVIDEFGDDEGLFVQPKYKNKFDFHTINNH
tara:strand:+ start:1685 stop:2038 length:354 start_codon:yes stop_codon:yes gene_type:complete